MNKNNFQAILFPKYMRAVRCLEWLKRHNYTPIKRAHVTKNYRRYRLIEPIEKYKYRTVHLGNEILAIQII